MPSAELIIGFGLGLLLASIIWYAVVGRRIERAFRAERQSIEAERLAELGAMTSGLAHEIKNPLSSIVLNAQLLREGVIDANLPEADAVPLIRKVDSLARETTRIRAILEDFLRYAGRFRLHRQPHDLRDVVGELRDFLLPQSEAASVLLRTDLPQDAVTAPIDADLIKQALLNLMLNAMQAMEANPADARKELILRVENAPAHARQPAEAVIHVIDTGPGIAPARQEEIFRPYVTERRGGSGLGLPVARRIVEEHGGRLTLFSEVGKGSDFQIRIPMAAPPQAPTATSASGPIPA
ncbi:MAG: two-component sensor histidine kinase [Phycisphaerae bacterium]|nr:two-component sensor histidine kinase [Phycisphaerae bacterium]